MALRPLHDRILVQRIEEEEQKVGGIIIPDSAKEKPQQGKVIAVGAGKADKDGKRIALDVKDGDSILFGKYSGQEIKVDGDEYLIMREDDVLAAWSKKATSRKRRRRRRSRALLQQPHRIFEASGAKVQWPNRWCTASSRGRRSSAASTSCRRREGDAGPPGAQGKTVSRRTPRTSMRVA